MATTARIPTTAAACAMHIPRTINSTYHHHALLSSCCGPASVTAHPDDCSSYYCLAQGQTISDLAEYLRESNERGEYLHVWCDAEGDATGSGTAKEAVGFTVAGTGTGTGTRSESEPESPGILAAALSITIGANGLEVQTVSVTTALLLLLMALGGVVRPVP
ncbi:hypothetical protein BDV18DRAFT_158765 [Aspergillus unguis]